ncbi:DUF4234 domain-containing protein [Lachnoanaerobaculum gingivalis]|uniref:DUF4234 domain-containing protein n=1 Tax=Lachnoanaerobaculum gingivalis TaxID=2490855 RepID=UPI0028D59258|nr:DUF4234 domain-containing protein [Lachnoanaerobaculum gingivalis]
MSTLQRKNIVTCIILSIVTCGFYSLYWLYCIVTDINTISEDPNAMSPVLVIILSFVTCGLYFLYWVYKAGSLLDQKMIETGRTAESRSVLYVVLALFCFAIVTYALMQDTINQLAESNMSKPSF